MRLITFLMLCFLAAFILTGCTPDPQPQIVTRTVYVRQSIPPSLLTCQPTPPVPQPTSQAVAAWYIVALWEAGQDCRVKLAGMKTIVSP